MGAVRYAIVDGCIVDDLLDYLAGLNSPHSCLYAEPLQPELVKLAPYILEVTSEVEHWLSAKIIPWGIYLTTEATMRVLRQHLRKYLQVTLPDESKPVIFRFYDPRNIWDVLSVLSDWEKHLFLSKISKIETDYQQYRSFSVQDLHERYPDASLVKPKFMEINKEQYKKLEQIFEKRYIEELALLIPLAPEEKIDIAFPLAELFFYYMRNIGITDKRSIDEIVRLFAHENIRSPEAIPTEYKSILEDSHNPGHYRAEKLLLHVYGKIPAWKRSNA
ncbi:DUF4123 domain-containing protein [Buttiauxella gaviniae]|uniref:DUF4123 domain-containing protein n=1 Tax=Buttiauxella gaviniae TaxID=82990 RepID=A0ABV3NYW3_9ENTR